jgi:hypothetical protein
MPEAPRQATRKERSKEEHHQKPLEVCSFEIAPVLYNVFLLGIHSGCTLCFVGFCCLFCSRVTGCCANGLVNENKDEKFAMERTVHFLNSAHNPNIGMCLLLRPLVVCFVSCLSCSLSTPLAYVAGGQGRGVRYCVCSYGCHTGHCSIFPVGGHMSRSPDRFKSRSTATIC